MHMKILLELFWAFFKVSLVSYGGGYVMFMLLRHELIEKRGWITEEELTDYFAIGTSTPGIISVNTATFVGYKKAGIAGASIATLGVILPSIIIISLLASFLRMYMDNAHAVSALKGIKVGLAALMAVFIYDLGKTQLRRVKPVLVFLLSLVLIFAFNLHVVAVILLAGISGYLMNRDWGRSK